MNLFECPECGESLFYDAKANLLICPNCERDDEEPVEVWWLDITEVEPR
jgi:uncharacterized Zn finger protein (UPF0148 family)